MLHVHGRREVPVVKGGGRREQSDMQRSEMERCPHEGSMNRGSWVVDWRLWQKEPAEGRHYMGKEGIVTCGSSIPNPNPPSSRYLSLLASPPH